MAIDKGLDATAIEEREGKLTVDGESDGRLLLSNGGGIINV